MPSIQPAIVHFENLSEPAKLYPDASGQYHCPCGCRKTYLKPKYLEAHLAGKKLPPDCEYVSDTPLPQPDCQHVSDAPLPQSLCQSVPESPLPQSDWCVPETPLHQPDRPTSPSERQPVAGSIPNALGQLSSPEFLSSLGYIANEEARVIICTGCNDAVLPSFASTHGQKQHKMPTFKLDVLKPYIAKFGLFETADEFEAKFMPRIDSPALRPPPPVAFDGIEVEPGYHCPLCCFGSQASSTMQKHYRSAHAGIPRPDLVPGPVQFIYLTPQFSRWLPVRLSLSSPEKNRLLQACLEAYSRLPDLPPPHTATREPPPWLRKAGWDEWVSEYDSKAVDKFIQEVNKHPVFDIFHKILSHYLKDAMAVLLKMPPQIRQTLRTVRKDVKPLMFSPPDNDNSIDRYAGVMAFVMVVHLLLLDYPDPPLPLLLNPTQRSHMEALRDLSLAKDVSDTDLKSALHEALISLLLHELQGPQVLPKGEPVIMALIWYNRTRDGSFKRPGTITQTFAAVQFVARSAALKHVCTRAESPQGSSNYIREMADLHPLMIQGSMTPLGVIYCYWIILLKAALEEVGLPDFMYTSPDDMSFTLRGSPGTVDDLRRMVRHHIDQAERVLFQKLLLGLNFPELSQLGKHIYDDTSNTQERHSFVKDKRNRFPDGYSSFMRAVINAEDNSFQSRFGMLVEEEWVWSKQNCLKWLDDGQKFLEHLLVASHMTHGQPTRGTEIMSTTFANMENYPRSIYYVANEGVNALAPNKVESMTMQRQLSPHWFCPENSRQLLIYLVFIRPVEIAMAKAVLPPEVAANYEFYLFTGPNGRWTSPTLSALLRHSTRDFLGVDSSFGLADMRQILIALCYRHCNSLYSESESKSASETFAEEIGDRQANHSSKTARAHYGVQQSEIKDVPSTKVRALRRYSRGVQAFFRVAGPHPDSSAITHAPGCPPDINTDTNTNHKAVLAAIQHELNDVRDLFKMSVTDMKMWLAECLQSSIADSANAVAEAIKNDSVDVPSYDHVPSASLLASLQTYNPSMRRFRSDEQASVLARVVKGKEHQLAVLPTGEGKSLFWMLPAKTTWVDMAVIVVVPLVALMLDLERRCQAEGIKYARWTKSELDPDHGVLFVSAEQAVTADFYSFARGLVSRHRLAHIVLEECHLVLTAKSYRPSLQWLKNLFGLGAPVLCTTATLPPHLVPKFKAELGVTQLRVTRRVNKYARIRINVDVKDDPSQRIEAVLKKAREWLPILEATDSSAIIVCRSVEDCQYIASQLKVEPYHGSLDVEEKAKRFAAFATGKVRFLVCTTGGGTGVHVPNAIAIIHDGPPYDILTYVQNIGRVGRETDRVSFSYLVADETQRWTGKEKEDTLGEKALNSMVFGDLCRKLSLSSFTEGAVISCLSNEVLCDVCQRQLEQTGGKYDGLSDLPDSIGRSVPLNKASSDREPEGDVIDLTSDDDVGVSRSYVHVDPATPPRGKRRLEDADEPLPRAVRPRLFVPDTPPPGQSIRAPSMSNCVRDDPDERPYVFAPDTPPSGRSTRAPPLQSSKTHWWPLLSSSQSIKTHLWPLPSSSQSIKTPSRPLPSSPSSPVFTLQIQKPPLSALRSSKAPSRPLDSSSSFKIPSSPPFTQMQKQRPSTSYSSVSSFSTPSHSSSLSSIQSFASASSSSMAIKMQQAQTLGRKKQLKELDEKTLLCLEKLRQVCVLCWLRSDKFETQHCAIRCRQTDGWLGQVRDVNHWTVPTDFKREHMCYGCYLPNQRYDSYQHGGLVRQDDCHFRHILKPLIWACWNLEELKRALIAEFRPYNDRGAAIKEEEREEWGQFFRWCFRKHVKGDTMNYLAVLLWVCSRSRSFASTYMS